jgi:hypothetical protein
MGLRNFRPLPSGAPGAMGQLWALPWSRWLEGYGLRTSAPRPVVVQGWSVAALEPPDTDAQAGKVWQRPRDGEHHDFYSDELDHRHRDDLNTHPADVLHQHGRTHAPKASGRGQHRVVGSRNGDEHGECAYHVGEPTRVPCPADEIVQPRCEDPEQRGAERRTRQGRRQRGSDDGPQVGIQSVRQLQRDDP